jgi:hypothetical protein
MNFDDELRRAFRRQPAPSDFADRVLARLEQRDVRPATIVLPRVPAVRWLVAAAASTLVAIGGTQYYRHRQTVAEAERVQQEVRLALEITVEKLAVVQRKLQDPTK